MFTLFTERAVREGGQGKRWYSKLKSDKAYRSRDAPTSLTFNNCTLCPHYIYVFCIYPRTNSDLCHLQHKLIGFYDPDEKCLQRGTDWSLNKAYRSRDAPPV